MRVLVVACICCGWFLLRVSLSLTGLQPNKSMEDAREDARSTDDTESAPSSARAHGNTRLLQQQADWSDDRATFAEETVEVSEDQELNARRGSH